MSDYEPTSERLSEADYQSNPADYLIYCCHLATYDFAAPLVAGRRVLDFGCGTGYGTHRLAPGCETIVGVDVSADAVGFATETYQAPNLEYRAIEPLPEHPTPFADGSFSAVVSFQVIEHIWAVDAYAAELARVLEPGGVAVIATPDRATRLFPSQRPWNLYHVIEYDADGFRAALAPHFTSVEMFDMAAPGVDDIELRRAKKLRLVTYPVTFPHAPEAVRTTGLKAFKWVQAQLKKRRSASDAAPRTYPFGPEDVRIAPGDGPSLNLVAVCRR